MADRWQADFFQNNILFKDLSSVATWFKDFTDWPALNDYNTLLRSEAGDIHSLSGASLGFVAQAEKPRQLHDSYEARIYLKGEIQTRLQNWHDFFQVMVWSSYPRTKQLINQLHYKALSNRAIANKRSTVENSLTLFDECGAIIVSSDSGLLKLLVNFEWNELFLTHREAFNRNIKCFIFGHALFEKCLNPYIGMTAHCICLDVEDSFFSLPLKTQQQTIDSLACSHFRQHRQISPRELHPYPLLGTPGWDSRNEDPAYYQNVEYFRPGRRNAS
jgi:hypothetical protein